MKLSKISLVAALFLSMQVQAINIENSKAEINRLSFRLDAPSSSLAAGAFGGGIGGLIGGVAGALVGQEQGLALGLLAGVIVGGAAGLYVNNDYRRVYEKSEGLNMQGAAAANNVPGICALHEYVLKGEDADYNVIGRDANGCTPLMHAAATGATDAAKMIIHLSPVTTKILESTGSSVSTSFHGNLAQGTIDPVVSKAEIKNYKDIPTIDLVDNLKQTAAHYAVQTNHPGVLKVLIKNGADLGLVDKRGRTVTMIAHKHPHLLGIINDDNQ